jgi:hypothetical protein
MRGLLKSMNTGIGAPRRAERITVTAKLENSGLNRALHTRRIILPLPSGIG